MAKKHIDIELKKLYANAAMKWCKKNMGLNKRKKTTPKISVRIRFKNDDKKNWLGSYWANENRIIIYDSNCESLEEVVATVIHEYTHYLQSMKKYWEYFQTHYYSTHPLEKEAQRNELRYTKKCLSSIRKSIN